MRSIIARSRSRSIECVIECYQKKKEKKKKKPYRRGLETASLGRLRMRRSVFARDTKRTQEADLAWLPQSRHLILWVCVCFLLSVFFVFRIFCSFFLRLRYANVTLIHSHSHSWRGIASGSSKTSEQRRSSPFCQVIAKVTQFCRPSHPLLPSSPLPHLSRDTSYLRYPQKHIHSSLIARAGGKLPGILAAIHVYGYGQNVFQFWAINHRRLS